MVAEELNIMHELPASSLVMTVVTQHQPLAPLKKKLKEEGVAKRE